MLILEGLSVRYALHEVKQYRLQPCMIKSDNQTIVGKINRKRASDVYTTQNVQDIKNSMALMECAECWYISRQANQGAHYITFDPDFNSINHDLKHIFSFIQMDVKAS